MGYIDKSGRLDCFTLPKRFVLRAVVADFFCKWQLGSNGLVSVFLLCFASVRPPASRSAFHTDNRPSVREAAAILVFFVRLDEQQLFPHSRNFCMFRLFFDLQPSVLCWGMRTDAQDVAPPAGTRLAGQRLSSTAEGENKCFRGEKKRISSVFHKASFQQNFSRLSSQASAVDV